MQSTSAKVLTLSSSASLSSAMLTQYSKPDFDFRHYCSCVASSVSADTDVSLTDLQADLEAAVSAEDYKRAATIRDELM